MRAFRILLPLLSIILVAPFVVVALVALLAHLHSVSLSVRLFAGQASTSLISLPHPLTAVAILVGSAIILFAAFRFRS